MQNRIRGLDGLRGLAAIAVLIHHALITRTRLGVIAVDLFFVLSGYLIIGILHDLRAKIGAGELSRGAAFGEFWQHRMLRIVPAYYATILIFAAMCVMLSLPSTGLGWYLAYLQNFSFMFGASWPGMQHTWSLAVEQQFYVLFAAVLLLFSAPRHLAIIVAIGAVSCIVFAIMAISGVSEFYLMQTPTTAFPYLTVGGLLYLLPIKMPGAFAAFSIFLLCAVVVSGFDKGATVFVPYWLCKLIELPTLAAIMAFIIDKRNSRAVFWLERPVLVWLGALSYSIYLLHFPIMNLTGYGLGRLGITHPIPDVSIPLRYKLLHFCIVAGASLAAAALMRKFVEIPFLRLKSRKIVPAPAVA